MTPSYQPTPQQELCLQAALLSGDAALGAWRKTGAAFHLDQLDDSCQTLLPLVYGNLARQAPRDASVQALKDRYLQTWSDNQRCYQSLRGLLDALAEAGVETIVLK